MDFAESFAHYLHITDTLSTAATLAHRSSSEPAAEPDRAHHAVTVHRHDP